jgi:hypothetical protein
MYLSESVHDRDPHTPVLIVPVFTVAKLWNQPRYPSMNECIKKIWYIYTVEYYLAIKKNEIMSFSGKWAELVNGGQSNTGGEVYSV